LFSKLDLRFGHMVCIANIMIDERAADQELLSSNNIPHRDKKTIPHNSLSTIQQVYINKGFYSHDTTVSNKVIIQFSKTGFKFIYPNHKSCDVTVNLTDEEYINGAKDQNYLIKNGPIKAVYFADDSYQIQVDFRNGDRIIYNLIKHSKRK